MKKYFLVLFVATMLASCQSKESYIKDFDAFIEKVEQEYADYTTDDWAKADKKFARFSEETYKKFADEFSMDEKKEIAKFQTTYAALKAKAGIRNFGKDIKEATKKLDEAIKEE